MDSNSLPLSSHSLKRCVAFAPPKHERKLPLEAARVDRSLHPVLRLQAGHQITETFAANQAAPALDISDHPPGDRIGRMVCADKSSNLGALTLRQSFDLPYDLGRSHGVKPVEGRISVNCATASSVKRPLNDGRYSICHVADNSNRCRCRIRLRNKKLSAGARCGGRSPHLLS